MESVQTIALFTSVLDGGTWRYVREMVGQWRKQKVNILLIRADQRILKVDFWGGERHDSYEFPFAEDMKFLVKLMRTYHVGLIHYQHTLDTELALLKLPEMLNIPYVVTLHDYYFICPFIKLTHENGIYCREKSTKECRRCLARRTFYSKTFHKQISSISFWREFWNQFIANAECAIVPNEDVKDRFSRYYTDVHYRVIENPEIVAPDKLEKKNSNYENRDEIRIGVLGILSISKGRDVLLECAHLADKGNLSFHFILFGELSDYKGPIPKSLIVKGRYEEDEIYELIAKEEIDFFWFPAILPETYSYTLSIPIRAGYPVLGTDLGAIGQRIKAHHWGEVYKFDENPEVILDRLKEFAKGKSKYTDLRVRNTTYPNAEDYYQFQIDKKDISVEYDEITDLRRREAYERNHSSLQCLHGKELKRMVQLSNSPLSKIQYVGRIDKKWLCHFLTSHSPEYIIKKIIN